MPNDRTHVLIVHIQAGDGMGAYWFWTVHRHPDAMLMLRSRPVYTDDLQAMEAGIAAAAGIGRKLGIPIGAAPDGVGAEWGWIRGVRADAPGDSEGPACGAAIPVGGLLPIIA